MGDSIDQEEAFARARAALAHELHGNIRRVGFGEMLPDGSLEQAMRSVLLLP